MTPDQLIASLDGGQQQVEHPEGFNPDEFNTHFKRITGLESPDEVKALLPLREKVPTLEQQLNELKVKANTNPFTNDFAKNINEMLANGKGAAELIPYIQLQLTDFDKMDSAAAIKMHKKLEMPGWDDSKVNTWFNKTFPAIDEEAENAEQLKAEREIDIDLASKEAREALSKQKADMTLPDNGNEARQQQFQQRVEKFTPVITTLMDRFKEIPVLEEFEDGGKYEFNYKVDLDPQVRQYIMQNVVNYHAGRGTPMTEAGLRQMQESVNKLVMAATAEDRIKSIIRDAYASSTEQQVMRVSNVNPVAKGSGQPPKVPKEKRETIKTVNGVQFA